MRTTLINRRTDINRIWYRDTYTKRFCRFLKMSARADLTQNAEEAVKRLEGSWRFLFSVAYFLRVRR